MKKRLLQIFLFAFFSTRLWALPDQSYFYSGWDESIESPAFYQLETTFTGIDLGTTDLSAPSDIFIGHDKTIYILDSGNQRIIVLDEDFTLSDIIDTFYLKDTGEPTEISKFAKGLFVNPKGDIYVTDPNQQRFYKMDHSGGIDKIFKKPDSEMLEEFSFFEVTNILVDRNDIIYLIAGNINKGIVTMDQQGKFMGYFATDHIESTLEVLKEMFWRRILSERQALQRSVFQPLLYSNFDIDQEDFIYTVIRASVSVTSTGQLKKLNPRGTNILEDKNYGDLETQTRVNNFSDVSVDYQGFINVLDDSNNKIFQYDQEGSLLAIFGGLGDTKGNFRSPTAIESLDSKIVVLDSLKNTLSLFRPTYFGEKVRKAVILYNQGMFLESIEPWQEVLKLNQNYHLAHQGIGEAWFLLTNYREAMKSFKKANDQILYSEAKKEYRIIVLRKYFAAILVGCLLLAGAIFAFRKFYSPIKSRLSARQRA